MQRVVSAGRAVLLVGLALAGTTESLADPPRVLDERLVIERIAAEPDIVTPTGLAVDARGRVLVVESHTHFRPADYDGPQADRIRLIDDADGNGRPERVRTFFEGSRYTMNIAIARDGGIYVAARSEIFRLRDTDGDDVADEKVTIARLETAGDYPHNGLSGFAFDFDDNVFFGLGENLGATYRLLGSDGTALEGGGEGGSIYRCRPDGSQLVRIATGFWNPFHVASDAFDRLYAVDNDPDSRPPCRLLHIVPDGDYGYRYRNGRKGVHPFTAWNGELPGTLPMLSGTGEAPSGVLSYEHELLPDEYFGTLLATSWGDHRIERFRLERQGASFRAAAEPIVTGGDDFRPVGIALAPDGSLYVSDWVDRSYDLHGKGRVWRIRPAGSERAAGEIVANEAIEPRQLLNSRVQSVREHAARLLAAGDDAQRGALVEALRSSPDDRVRASSYQALWVADQLSADDVQVVLADPSPEVRSLALRTLPAEMLDRQQIETLASSDAAEVRAAAVARLAWSRSAELLRGALTDADPFIRSAALSAIRHTADFEDWRAMTESDIAAVRLAGTLLVRAADHPRRPEVLAHLCDDPDPTVQFAAVQGIGEARLTALNPLLVGLLLRPGGSRELFEGCLASLERLAGVTRTPPDELPGEQYVLALLNKDDVAKSLQIRALRMLRPDHPALQLERLAEMQAAAGDDEDLAIEVVRTLRERPEPQRLATLREIAKDESHSERFRAEAIMGLTPDDAPCRELLWKLAAGTNTVLRDEALRSLAGAAPSEAEMATLDGLDTGDPHLARLVARVRGATSAAGSTDGSTAATDAPIDVDAWLARLDEDGSAEVGERIFFHLRGAGCWRCHQIEGRGRSIGPDLSSIGGTRDRLRLLASLVDPSRAIAPLFVPWTIETVDGLVRTGLLVSETVPLDSQHSAVQQQYVAADGTTFLLDAADVARREPSRQSIMPQDVVHGLSDRELADLLAYLSSRR
ncbi:MAG: PVC-type heme-binding CxxCH protein [Pirellulales bacterium]